MSRISYFMEVKGKDRDQIVESGGTRVKWMARPYQHLACVLTALDARGFLQSAEHGVPMRGGEPYPLLTWPFLDWIESFDFGALRIAEFGSGASTLYFAARFRAVQSFETDAAWHERIAGRIGANVDYRLIAADDLVAGNWSVDADMVLIDCAANRLAVATQLLAKAAPPFVVLDNAEWYPNAARAIREAGYHEVPFWGFKCSEDWESCTTLFIRRDATLPPRRDTLPPPLARPSRNNAWDRLA